MPIPQHLILPGTGAELLRRELALAFAGLGAIVSQPRPEALLDPKAEHNLDALLDGREALFLSVNFQGLTPLRPILEKLDRAGARAAVWCVDNPWNILSGVRDPLWKSLPLFVTDASFVGPLAAHGATKVFHLPLAACPELFAANAARDAAFPPPTDMAPLVFVGRSAFPGKDRFFSGIAVPDDLLREARAMLGRGARPDLAWWEERLCVNGASFWPGKTARSPALGAESANLTWRAMCLAAAAKAGSALFPESAHGLDIFGDAGWQGLMPPKARLLPPVDYYARLPGIYATARYSLCLTSMQLPQGLNQRHFDTWMAGGTALCDASPGLALFPEELTRPVTFRSPADIASTLEKLEGATDSAALRADWQACLKQGHTYRHRALALIEALDSSG